MRIAPVAALVLALLLVGCIRFSPTDVCERDTVVNGWLSETTARINTINTASELTAYDLQNIYEEQRDQITPQCLETAQAYAIESFRYQFEAAKAMAVNDVAGSLSFLAQSADASAKMTNEIERIAEMNSWPRY